MSGFMVPTQGRSLLRFFAIDSEIFPLIATVSLTAGAAGYFAGSRQRSSDRNVVLADDGHPWSMANTNGNYKYRFYKHGDPKGETLEAPSATVSQYFAVNTPKDQIPRYMQK